MNFNQYAYDLVRAIQNEKGLSWNKFFNILKLSAICNSMA